ncbi:MAG: PKD domain-containing protein, partial [Candidatus Anammoxibacter sp.]
AVQEGGAGVDILTGNVGADVSANIADRICGNGGNDTISGFGGNDFLSGGAGDDFVNGNEGVDFVNGNAGNDTVHGGKENDEVHGGGGSDVNPRTNLINVQGSPEPVAEFNANPTAGFASLEVQFNNLTTGAPTGFAWKFGDGDTSSDESPLHTYKTAGIFTPSLLASNSAGADFETKTNLINVDGNVPPISEFQASPLTGFGPLTVSFTDTSAGNINNWSWSFGDGAVSNLQNPVHEYRNPGFFNVNLIVSGSSGTDNENKTNLINILPGESPTAAFFAEPLTGNAPFTVHFFDTSSGEVANHVWEFGDGDTSSDQDPVHTYKNTGSFNVKLTVSGKDGTDNESKTGLIEVVEGKDPTAAFGIDVEDSEDDDSNDEDSVTVKFTDLSSSPDNTIVSREWDFGDNTNSNEKAPVHTYTGKDGDTFTARLTVQNADGIDTVTKPAFFSIKFGDDNGSGDNDDNGVKSFTFNCENSMKRGFFFRLETLTMEIGDTESCTLRLTNHEPGKTVEVSSLLRKGFRSAIKVKAARSVTDENGELKITITAIRKGKDWAAWAVKNDKGQFRFNKKTYDAGLAWGMFVKVK